MYPLDFKKIEKVDKIMTQKEFFNEYDKPKRLSRMDDPLGKIAKVIDWGNFFPYLSKIFQKEEHGMGGHPYWYYVLMFKIILMQSWYGISDDKIEYMINDHLSFQQFLGLIF